MYKAKTCADMLEVEKEMLREMTDSITEYFDKALGMMLLYKEERPQYNAWRSPRLYLCVRVRVRVRVHAHMSHAFECENGRLIPTVIIMIIIYDYFI